MYQNFLMVRGYVFKKVLFSLESLDIQYSKGSKSSERTGWN